MYWGLLDGYYTTESGKLDRIVLSSTHRRRLSNDSAMDEENEKDASGDDERTQEHLSALPDDRYYRIRGDYLIIKYEDVRTLNIDYFSINLSGSEEA